MKHILQKSWLLMMCLLVGVGNAWADDVTFTFKTDKDITYTKIGESGGSTTNGECIVSKDDVTLVGTNAYTEATKSLSVYANSTLTITAPGNITAVELEYNGKVYPFDEAVGDGKKGEKFAASGAHAATYAPTTPSTSVTLTNPNGGKVELLSLKVTYVAGSATITVKTVDGNYTATCEVTVEDDPEPDEYVFLFAANGSNSDSGTAWSKTSTLDKVFAEGYQYISSIAATNNVYPARNSLVYGVKFGTLSVAGSISFTLKKPVKATYIVVSAAPYGDPEGQTGFTINGQEVSMKNGKNNVYEEYVVKLDGSDLSTITLTQKQAIKGRIYVEYIKLVKEDVYYAKKSLSLVAKDDDTYYGTFSSDKVTFFPDDYIVSAVGVENGQLYQFDNDEAFDEDIVEITGKDDVIGYYVPANTGVLVTSIESVVTYYTAEGVTPSNDVEEVNMLRPASKDKAELAGHKFYMLAYGDEVLTPSTLGFYYGAEDGAAFTSRDGSAYLAVPTSQAAKGFALNGGVTNIQSVNKAAQNNVMFNLAGQRVLNANGIVIKNGKKFVK